VEKPDVREAIANVRNLPTLPTLLGQILVTALDPDSSALDLGRYIAADQSLSATLLKVVNSAYYGFYRQITSVTTAIVILGFNEVRNLVLTASAFRAFPKGGTSYERVQLWRHSLAAAIATERTAKLLALDVEGTFVSGLLHDIGKVALDTLYPEIFREAVQKSHDEAVPLAEAEAFYFDLDHAEIGGLLAEHWNMPAPIVDAVRNHHDPGAASEAPQLAYLTSLGNFLTYQCDLGESGNGASPDLPDGSRAGCAVTEPQWSQVCESLEGAKERIDELLGIMAA